MNHSRRSLFAALCFPLALWVVAFLFLRGDTGFWSDDYGHNLRGPDGSPPAMAITSKWPLWTWGLKRDFFIRPLFYMIVPAWTTLVWNHPWIAHVAQTLMHAGIVLLLLRLLLRLNVRKDAATGAALMFMVYPGHYETVMWVAAFPTLLSVAFMLGVMFMVARFAAVRRGWWRVPMVGVACFAACCLNEQAVVSVAALPLVYWAALPAGQEFWTRRSVLRACVPAIVGAAALLVYVYLLKTSAPPGFRGSDQTMVAAADAPGRIAEFSKQVAAQLTLVDYVRGASRAGLAEVRDGGVWGMLLCAGLIVSAWFWVKRREKAGPETEPRGRRGVLVALGLSVFMTGWLPIVMMAGYSPDSRLRYWPCLGLALVLGAACSTRGRLPRTVMRAALAVILIASTLPNVGAQAAYRSRWLRDRSEGEQLRALVSNPAPFTLFQPLSIGAALAPTGSSEFDRRFIAVWWYPWCTRQFIQRVYGRDDIAATSWRGIGSPVLGADERGALYAVRLGPRYAAPEGGGSRVAWDHLIPFVVDESGRVRVVTTVAIPTAEGGETRVMVPQAASLDGVEIRLPRR